MKTIFDYIVGFLALISVPIIAISAIYLLTDTSVTTSTTYITAFDTALTDTEEETYFIELNYYTNDSDNGLEVQEMKFNYFTDYEFNELYGFGIQYIGDYSTLYGNNNKTWTGLTGTQKTSYKTIFANLDNYNSIGLDLYDYYGDASWESINGLDSDSVMVIEIDGEPYLFTLNKTITYTLKSWVFGITDKVTVDYSYYNFFEMMMDKIKTYSKSYGTYVEAFKFTDYFDLYAFDYDTMKFDMTAKADINDVYINIKFNLYEDGLVKASQSSFGRVGTDSTYGESYVEVGDYWQVENKYVLTNDNLTYRYSSVYDGYYVSLNAEAQSLIANSTYSYFVLNIDLTDNIYNILGLDYYGLQSVDINELNIIGNNCTFTFLASSLLDCGVDTITANTTITLVFAEDSGLTNKMGVAYE